MNYKKFLAAASVALLIVIVTLALAPGAWAQSKFKTLYKFNGADGANPNAGLTFDQAGNLYSTTENGGSVRGTVFELTPNQDGSWTESRLYSFDWTDGVVPFADVIFDAARNLYSTTFWGGANSSCNCGTVFELTPAANGTWTETVLHNFENDDNGASPSAGLTWDAAGSLYGATKVSGISSGNGVVFKLTPNQDSSWSESVLHRFKGGRDGAAPDRGNLIFDTAGNLYGSTAGGGKGSCNLGQWTGCGTIFELTPNADGSWTEHILHRFSGVEDGAAPEGALIFDASGNLYGTTLSGGAHGYGNVFELTPNADGSWKEKVLHQFTGGRDGANSYSGVIFDAAGNLYGTTYAGGNLSECGGKGCGVVFKLTPKLSGGWGETVLHVFHGTPGASPYAGLIFDAAGNLYGTTSGDGSTTFGSVFEITP